LYFLVKLGLVFVDVLSFCGSMQSLVASAPNSGCHFPQEVDCEWFCQGAETLLLISRLICLCILPWKSSLVLVQLELVSVGGLYHHNKLIIEVRDPVQSAQKLNRYE